MRKEIIFNDNWYFQRPGCGKEQVTLPHTWNGTDGQRGGAYLRTTCAYEKHFSLKDLCEGKPDFLRTHAVWLAFDGVNASAEVSLDGQVLCVHEGGYSTFRVDLTEVLAGTEMSAEHVLQVRVDNGVNRYVYPQKADFTFYGGIYRDVRLIVVPRVHIALGDCGAPGVFVTSRVKKFGADERDSEGCLAEVVVEAEIEHAPSAMVRICILDAEGQVVAEGTGVPASEPNSRILALNRHVSEPTSRMDGQSRAAGDFYRCSFQLENARLWNGLKDPHLYRARVRVETCAEGEGADAGAADEEAADEVEVSFGIREMHVDARQGFMLNGRPYPLHGVSRHQDRPGIGNAITAQMHAEDVRLILEMGANAVRLAHYQHAQTFYNLCDKYGLVVWAEIPYISEDMDGVEADANTRSQLTELILQNYNHPSIAVWGLSNEITISTKNRKSMLENHRQLNALAHTLDPSRQTVLACYAMCGMCNPVSSITDAVGWNLYLGWYVPGIWLNDLWLTTFHLLRPKRALCYSEYGAEGMPDLHSEKTRRGDQSEEYQALYHARMLRCFARHPQLWGTFAWTMFDFASSIRDEGGDPGKNHKGLVTFDRKIRKDAFYVYKAFWSKEPFVHIGSKRFVHRAQRKITIRVFSNLDVVTLYVDGKMTKRQSDSAGTHVFVFRNVAFHGNTMHVMASGEIAEEKKGRTVRDEAEFIYTRKPDPAYRLKKTKSANWV